MGPAVGQDLSNRNAVFPLFWKVCHCFNNSISGIKSPVKEDICSSMNPDVRNVNMSKGILSLRELGSFALVFIKSWGWGLETQANIVKGSMYCGYLCSKR